jgi:hypothetical protein
MGGLLPRQDRPQALRQLAAEAHRREAASWRQRGDEVRAQLHLDAAAFELAGAALEQRWADLTADEADGEPAGNGAFGLLGPCYAAEAELSSREVALQVGEVLLHAGEEDLMRRTRASDLREEIADERESVADARERAADARELQADQREGTTEVRELQRLQRLHDAHERRRAAIGRDQSAIEREEAASQRHPGYPVRSTDGGDRH